MQTQEKIVSLIRLGAAEVELRSLALSALFSELHVPAGDPFQDDGLCRDRRRW